MNPGSFTKFLLFLFFLAVFADLSIGQTIVGSSHDFSAQGWSGGEICLPCHTPHNADTSQIDAPLWNHQVTNTVFSLYQSSTMDSIPEQPRTISKLCLSCHDGVVAVNSFGTNIGSQYISGDSLIGTSLQDDHPISIYWSHQVKFTSGSGTCINCHNPSPTDFNPILPFFDRYLECATCHDVHNKAGNDHLLRLPLINSQLCLHCHGK